MPLKLYQRGDIWHVRGTVAGRRIRQSTEASDKQLAERIKADLESAAWRSHLDGPEAHVTFAQAVNAYLDAGKSERFLLNLLEYWRDTRISRITGESIRQSARKLYPGASNATLNRQVIKPTRAVLNQAADLWGLPKIAVKPFPERTSIERRPVTAAWVASFAGQSRADSLPHLAALAYFMFGTGSRIGEAVALRWCDVSLDTRRATIFMGKTGETRLAHLPAPVVTALANIPSNRRDHDLVFGYAERGSVSKVWRNVCGRAGIELLTPHSCRHGFATEMLRNGFDVKTVAKLGGWRDAAIVLKHYAHALEDDTVTDALFDTNLTQGRGQKELSTSNKKEKLR